MTAMLLGSNSLSRLRVLMTLFRLSWLLCSARRIRASAVISPSTIRSPARDSLCTLRRGGFRFILAGGGREGEPVSYTHLRAHETDSYLVCRLLLEKKKNTTI